MKVLVLGANGRIARLVIERLLKDKNNSLLLYLKNTDRLSSYADDPRVQLVDGDVLDTDKLTKTIEANELDAVYSSVGGIDLAEQTESIIHSMDANGLKRLVFISASGAHHEIPGKFGQWNEEAIADYLPGFRKSAESLEGSDLNYTIIRPAWLTDKDEIDYELTGRNEAFKGTEVSRKSVADLVVKALSDPDEYSYKV
ncbi:NAD-dependent dehydratase [Oenococcus alcoholitolerans]|uniref:NAD-dependent dehydratase n=1 Tax=Oenococcus alcoholitolerans TaxID=931074 RepID=A0ABR4XPY8_9LACO|nr:NAD-dependent dehydratase [Oenococcus alcoholitolerans]